jgi:hypothetical protein
VRSTRKIHDICKNTPFNHIPELGVFAMTGVSLTRIDHHATVCIRLIGCNAMDVFQNIFKTYCKKEYDFKILLILDNAPSYPDRCENIELYFLQTPSLYFSPRNKV